MMRIKLMVQLIFASIVDDYLICSQTWCLVVGRLVGYQE